MRSLFVILAAHVIGKKGFSTSRRPKNEFITVRNNSLFHGQVGNIHMERFSAYTVCHLDPKRTDRIAVVRFFCKETQGRLYKRKERFFLRKIPCIAGHTRPVKCSGIYRIVSWLTFHQCQLRPHIITDMFQFFFVITPRHHIKMCPNRSQSVAVSFVQVQVDPLFIYLISTTVL